MRGDPTASFLLPLNQPPPLSNYHCLLKVTVSLRQSLNLVGWHVVYENLHGHTTDTSLVWKPSLGSIIMAHLWMSSLDWLSPNLGMLLSLSLLLAHHPKGWPRHPCTVHCKKFSDFLPARPLLHIFLPCLLYVFRSSTGLTKDLNFIMLLSSSKFYNDFFLYSEENQTPHCDLKYFLVGLCLPHRCLYAVSVPGSA